MEEIAKTTPLVPAPAVPAPTVPAPAVEAEPAMPASAPEPTEAQARAKAGLARILTNGEFVYEDKFEPRNILLTGGAGFIGSHVAILLAKKYSDYKVREFSLCRGYRDEDPGERYIIHQHFLVE
jgi:hypothetical protein